MSASSSLPVGQDAAVRYKKRKANFTFSEVHILLDEVRKNRHIVVGESLLWRVELLEQAWLPAVYLLLIQL